MSTFVLVHGAYHGGWCWRDVAQLLRKKAHSVFTPTLTGLGERVHLRHDDIGLETHISDVANTLEFEDLKDVVLVGHSYGGCVISGVAEIATERIGHLIYVDAVVPENGQSLADARGRKDKPLFDAAMERGPKRFGDAVPAPDLFGVTDELQTAWMWDRMTPQPVKTLVDKIKLPDDRAAELPRTFIYCTKHSPIMARDDFLRCKEDPHWQTLSIPTQHDAMITDPDILTQALLQAIGSTE